MRMPILPSMEKSESKKWLLKHLDTVLVIFSILGGYWAMSSHFNEKFDKIDVRLTALEKDITIIKTVLITRNFVQPELFAKKEGQE